MRRENQTLMDDELSTLICKTDQVTPCFNALLHLILSRKLDLVLLTDCSHDRWQKTEATQNSCSSWVGPNLWMQMTCTYRYVFARLLSYSKRIFVEKNNETRREGRLNHSVMHFKKWDLVHSRPVFFWYFDFPTCIIIMVVCTAA